MTSLLISAIDLSPSSFCYVCRCYVCRCSDYRTTSVVVNITPCENDVNRVFEICLGFFEKRAKTACQAFRNA